ncbi:MAG: hypothetical protein M1820_004185 [Bogoriella megaspora]|nr:MAG: hypothetical protein M1820_004185 [Bogoriella megaspora]
MGAGESKPTGNQSQHVFVADKPVSFSSGLVNSLQESPETDSSRARNLEHQIQSRVTSELERLASQSSKHLSDLTAEATTSQSPDSSEPSLIEKAKDALTPGSSESEKLAALSHDSVQKEIESLKTKLDARKKIEKANPEVEKAREELVACLRTNDRRPLDCWKEVEGFKREVGRLEKRFVEGAMR